MLDVDGFRDAVMAALMPNVDAVIVRAGFVAGIDGGLCFMARVQGLPQTLSMKISTADAKKLLDSDKISIRAGKLLRDGLQVNGLNGFPPLVETLLAGADVSQKSFINVNASYLRLGLRFLDSLCRVPGWERDRVRLSVNLENIEGGLLKLRGVPTSGGEAQVLFGVKVMDHGDAPHSVPPTDWSTSRLRSALLVADAYRAHDVAIRFTPDHMILRSPDPTSIWACVLAPLRAPTSCEMNEVA